jgi:hypothetical protein
LPPIRREARVSVLSGLRPDGEKRAYIYINGAIVGIPEQGYAFYRDVLAGLYHVSVESYGRDLFQFWDVAFVPGQQVYAKILSLRSWVETGRNFSRDTFYVLIVPPTFAQAEFHTTPSWLPPSRSALWQAALVSRLQRINPPESRLSPGTPNCRPIRSR